LICPKTGSTIALRILYTARPASVRNFSRIASFGDAPEGGGSRMNFPQDNYHKINGL
jgi:hypothetical protein